MSAWPLQQPGDVFMLLKNLNLRVHRKIFIERGKGLRLVAIGEESFISIKKSKLHSNWLFVTENLGCQKLLLITFVFQFHISYICFGVMSLFQVL